MFILNQGVNYVQHCIGRLLFVSYALKYLCTSDVWLSECCDDYGVIEKRPWAQFKVKQELFKVMWRTNLILRSCPSLWFQIYFCILLRSKAVATNILKKYMTFADLHWSHYLPDHEIFDVLPAFSAAQIFRILLVSVSLLYSKRLFICFETGSKTSRSWVTILDIELLFL